MNDKTESTTILKSNDVKSDKRCVYDSNKQIAELNSQLLSLKQEIDKLSRLVRKVSHQSQKVSYNKKQFSDMLHDLKSREQRIQTKWNEQQNGSNLNNCGKLSELDTVSFATRYECDMNLHTDNKDIITVITTAMFVLFCEKIYVQGLYHQTVVIEENGVNVKKYEKCMVINVNEYLIMMHHEFFGLNVSVNYVNVKFVDHEHSRHQYLVLLLKLYYYCNITYEFYCLLHAALSVDPRNCGIQKRKYYVAS